jgi:N-methylhydantoinase A/oxoprolinase/acetone carboxylase beta subunit
MTRRALQIGIDTGGTFTDFVVRAGAEVRVHKVLSTPDDPSRAVLAGLAELFPGRWEGEITYGSTVATNALLERRGAQVAS